MAKRHDWRILAQRATELVLASQKANTKWLITELGISVSSVMKLMKRLEAKGIVRRGKQRRWMVIQNSDGTPKSDAPEKRRFKKVKKHGKSVGAMPAAAQPTKASTEAISSTEKAELIRKLCEHAEGRSKAVLTAILGDIAARKEADPLLGLLKTK